MGAEARDATRTRKAAAQLIGEAGLDRLAEHDAALMHHATEIGQLTQRLDLMLKQAATHAEQVDAKLTNLSVGLAVVDGYWSGCRPGVWNRLRWLFRGTWLVRSA